MKLGRLPPLVSHRTTQSAPASAAAFRWPARTPGRPGSRRRSARRRRSTSLPCAFRNATLSPDHGQVLLEGGGEHVGHVQGPGLAVDADGGRAGLDQRAQVGVVGGRHAGLAGAAERGQPGVLQLQLGPGAAEELDVLGVRARVAALDVVNAEAVQHARNLQLVLHREGQTLALGPVSKRRVEQLDLHRVSSPASTRRGKNAQSNITASRGGGGRGVQYARTALATGGVVVGQQDRAGWRACRLGQPGSLRSW